MKDDPTRRDFLRTGLAALPTLTATPLLAGARPSERAAAAPAPHRPDTPRSARARYDLPDKFGVGGTQIGNNFKVTPDEEAYAMLEAAWDAGVRYFDTSPWYGLGLSERRLGNFLDDKEPDAYVVSTKIGRLLVPDASVGEVGNWKGRLNFDYRYEYTAEGTRRSVEDSLQRLGLPKIDLVFVHDLAPSNSDLEDWRAQFETAAEGAMPELTRMREEGMIDGWGMGVNDIEPSLMALDAADPDVILQATEYSIVKHADALERLFPRCEEQDVSIVVGAPLNAGFLAGVDRWHYGGEMPAEMVDRRERLHRVALKHNVDPRSAALQFTAAPEVVAATIPGARDADQARENWASMSEPVPAAFWADLQAEGLLAEGAPLPS